MIQNFHDIRTYKFHNDETGRNEIHKLKYTVIVRNGKVENVVNENNYTVNKNSEVFEYYSLKFNK